MIQADTAKPLITVVGASSKQGRSVAEALLASGRYRVRALTRRRDSQPAQILAHKGAEVVVAPLELGTGAELTVAMSGSYGAFLMTPPIVKVPPEEIELTLGMELANAAVAAGVEHVVFSGLENVEARTGGTKWAPHFTERAHYASAYSREDLLRHFPNFAADEHLVRELVGMVEYAVDYGYYAPDRDLTWSRKIDPHALTWEQFVKRSNWQGDLLSYGATSEAELLST